MNAHLKRFLWVMAASMLFGWLVSEVSFRLVNRNVRNTPQRLELVIPAGTAQRVAQGEGDPRLPESMTFIQGDVLVVVNQDDVSHQLGPVWVPAGGSGSLTMGEPNSYSYDCSFQPQETLGVDVQPRLTSWIRVQGVISVGLPSGVLFWLYSLVIRPVGPRKEEEQDEHAAPLA